jgi:hypothetical protein
MSKRETIIMMMTNLKLALNKMKALFKECLVNCILSRIGKVPNIKGGIDQDIKHNREKELTKIIRL